MLNSGVNTIEPAGPQGAIVPSFCFSISDKHGFAPYPPE